MITSEGRRQLCNGTFKVEYVTFSDGDVSYITDATDGHEDPTNKIYFETLSLPQDQITFEANDEGKLNPMRVQNTYVKTPGMNLSSSYSLASIVDGKMIVTERFFGRRVKVSDISENVNDLNLGFIYSDSMGKTGSVLINPSLNAGKINVSTPVGGPYVAHVGTKFGLNETTFAQMISDSVNSLSAGGGPACKTHSQSNVVFFEPASSIVGDKSNLIYSGTLSSPIQLDESLVGGRVLVDEIENVDFASQITGVLSSSFDNLLDLRLISTVDRQEEDDQFNIDKNEISFQVERIDPVKTRSMIASPPQLDSIDSIFNDDKLSHLENFMYLPPILKGTLIPFKEEMSKTSPNKSTLDSYLLGDYPSWGDNEKKLDLTKIQEQISSFESRDLVIDRTSFKNNIIAQMFEVANNTVTKLDVVDYGWLKSKIIDDPNGESRRVFFVGKVFLDNRGTTCFVNMFTLITSRIRREET
jgi:hypothetical protein